MALNSGVNQVITMSDSSAAKKILCIIEDEIDQKLLSTLLQAYPYTVEIAVHAWEAIGKVRNTDYHLIFVSCSLTSMDPFHLCSVLRRIRRTDNNIPIIGMVQRVALGFREKMIAAGMNDYIAAPITPERIKAIFKKWGGEVDHG